MTAGDYAAMGRLGTRTPLVPRVPVTLVRAGEQAEPRRRGRRRARPTEPAEVGRAAELVDYSVTGIGLAVPAGVELHANEVCVLRAEGADTRIRVIGAHPVDGEPVWGAMFLDPWPPPLRTIEASALHRDLDAEQTAWNNQRD
jgi:hypothetical protein